MAAIAYRAQALGPLGKVDWTIPAGVSVIVGPNRVGKSTLLRVPKLIAHTFNQGIHEGFKAVFEGVPLLRNLRVPSSVPMTLGLRVNHAEWEVELTVQGGRLANLPGERLLVQGDTLLSRKFGSTEIESESYRFSYPGLLPSLAVNFAEDIVEGIKKGNLPGTPDLEDPTIIPKLRGLLPSGAPDEVIPAAIIMVWMYASAAPAISFRTYHYEINHLLRFGSVHSSSLQLEESGQNVFPLLRNWRDRPELEERYEFVLTTMREIFPHLGRVGFEQAGQTSTMVVSDRRWPGDTLIPVARESTGFITALLHLCALASCPRGGLVTFDEIETSLHPRAIRVLVEACRSWASKHDLRVVIATQSQTVLDQFREEPSQVFVLEPGQEVSPQSLTDLFSPEYLSQFSLGDLFAHLEFGGDSDDEPTA
ncbi:MAG: AAA family ATPase [Myxococcota bacterium]